MFGTRPIRHNKNGLKPNELFVKLWYSSFEEEIGDGLGEEMVFSKVIPIVDGEELPLLVEALELLIIFSRDYGISAELNMIRKAYKYWDILESYGLIKRGIDNLKEYHLEFNDGNNNLYELILTNKLKL